MRIGYTLIVIVHVYCTAGYKPMPNTLTWYPLNGL